MVSIALGRFPPFGIIIAGFLVGFISAKTREGTIMAGFLAVLAAIFQLAVLNSIIPFVSLSPSILLAGFDGLSDFLVYKLGIAQLVAIYPLYFLFGALGGFLGSLIK